ncbi:MULTISPECIES: DMT family transporter [Acinetobacter]|uniref:DMT family transporter n=1 Tax=Acinetobacter TaxID=469 RepID=UPI00097F90AD|nr:MULTISPECIES: DMT family transporter [Acinetobacter]MEB3795175.1 DMT family transporter [Acinetobacter sp. IK24]MEB3814424.1 DMT family transporter [Acinetobacter sp. IK22]MEB3833625.1 DMT family transporter [Acinetobacter sp. IK23]MEB3837171.1 DMT family transporter [Acinetobacter sp. IK25]ONN58582.1 membrane protein [Acinetobacter genomosp. 33YU]
MILIFAAALCSVLVSVLLKNLKKKGYQPMQMIAWNYASASLLCYWWFKPDIQHISIQNTPWWLIFALGIILPSIFLCLAKSLEYAGIVKTEIAQRLSVVLSLLAAYFFFHEQFSSLKLLGIGLGIFAVFLIVFGQFKGSSDHQSKKAIFALMSVWFGYAAVDILLKYTSSLGLQFTLTLNLIFITSFVLSIIYLFFQKKSVWNFKNTLAGLLLGVLNFSNIALYVKAHILLKDSPAIVFASMNILVVLLGIVCGVVLYKEKLKLPTMLGTILGISGLVCLALTMK